MSLRITGAAGNWQLDGALDRETIVLLQKWGREIPPIAASLHLEMANLEIKDSEGTGAAVDLIRSLLPRCENLVIHHAPQLLAHTLYRIGMLEEGSRLRLSEWREEEPYG